MRATLSLVVLCAAIAGAQTQSPEPPLADARLSVHTLVREDIFAGFLANDMVRFERGERSVEQLLKERPTQRGNLLAWRGGASMQRALMAHEAGNSAEFLKHFEAARAAFAEAKAAPGNDGVAAVTGGSYAVFADRLPEPQRTQAWQDAYAAYSLIWKQQGPIVDKLPVHHRGELLGGLAQSAQRTGRTDEVAQYLDRMIALLPATPYEATAQQWKANPASAASSKLTCKNCHNAGRLAPTLASLSK